jgi:hypothetical protein
MVDSGCSRHMTFYKKAFKEYYKLQQPISISTATGAFLQGIAEGIVVLEPEIGGHSKPVILIGVLHVPGLTGSLISVMQLQDRGITVTTEASETGLALTLGGKTISRASRVGRAYMLSTKVPESAYEAQELVDPELVHRRLGYLNYSSLQGIESVTIGLSGPVAKLEYYCSGYTLAKTIAIIHRARPERTTKVLGRLWMD